MGARTMQAVDDPADLVEIAANEMDEADTFWMSLNEAAITALYKDWKEHMRLAFESVMGRDPLPDEYPDTEMSGLYDQMRRSVVRK